MGENHWHELRPGQLNGLARLCRDLNHRWWCDPATGEPKERNVGEMFALMHSELSEALEAHRKGLMDTHLPDRPGLEVELADLLIRVFDFAGEHGLDLDGAVAEKLAYNAQRVDHTDEARLAPGGKRY